MRKFLLAVAALCLLFARGAAAQTTITGTFLTNSGQTPQAAGLTVLQQIAGTDVCGQLRFSPYNASAQTSWSLLWNGKTYAPSSVIGYIRCSDGALVDSTGAVGVSVVPTVDAQPSGTLEWMRGGLDGSSDGTVSPVSWSEAKAVPDQTTVDWGTLPVASIVDVGYQTVESAGTPLTVRTILNFVNGGCADNANLNRTDCTLSGSGGSVDVNSSLVSTPNFNSTSPLSDANFLAATWKVSGSNVIAELPVFGASGTSHSIGLVPDPGATAGSSRYLNENGTWTAPPGGVSTVFGRTGAVVAQTGDYSFSQLSGTATETQIPSTVVLTDANATFGAHSYDFSSASGFEIPKMTDPATPSTGEVWVNVGALKYRDNAATPATHLIEVQDDKGAANGYAGLGANSLVPASQLGSGTADANHALLGSQTYGTFAASFNGRTGAVTPQSGDYSYSQISGTPTLFYQTFEDNGVSQTQRGKLNIIPGSNITETCADNSGANSTDCTLSASLTAGSAWSSLGNPAGALALSMATYPTTFTYGAATGSGVNLFTITDSASNTGTGALFRSTTASGSAAIPAELDANGNGIEVTSAGLLTKVGTGGIDLQATKNVPGSNGQLLFNNNGAVAAEDPVVSQAYVNLFNAASATATQTSASVRNPIFSQTGTLIVTWASITGSPVGCTLQVYGVDSLGNALNDGSALALSPANGTTSQLFSATSTLLAAAQIKAVFSCSTYPTAGTLSVDYAPIPNVVIANTPAVTISGTPTISGTVTANAGTGTFTVGQSSGANLHVDIDSIPSLPTGSNTIGTVDSVESGSWTVTANAGSGNFNVVGTQASNSVVGNGLEVLSGRYDSALPTLTSGDAALAELDASGRLFSDLDAIGGTTFGLGQNTSANSLSVVLASDYSTPDAVGASGALGALNNAITVATNNNQAVGFEIPAGTLIGTLVPEVSYDGGTTWYATEFLNPSTGAVSSSVVFASANAATSLTVLLPGGVSNARVRVSAYTSGTVTGQLRATLNQSVEALIVGSLPAGSNVIGGVTQSGTWNVGISGTPTVTANAGSGTFGTKDAADMTGTAPGAAPANTQVVGAIYNSSSPAPTTGQTLPLQADSAGRLIIDCASGCGGSGGASLADEGAFTQGTTSFTPIGGYYNSTITNLTSGQGGAAQMTATRHLMVDVADAIPAGANVIGKVSIDQTTPGTTNAVQATNFPATVDTNTGNASASTPRVVLASNQPTIPVNQTQIAGSSLVASPCMVNAISSANVSLTGSGQIISGISGKQTYICGVILISASADNVSMVEGTGSNCATGTTGMSGGTTAATGWNLGANGGFVEPSAGGWYQKTATAADNVCLLLSGSTQVSGNVLYVQQ